MKLNASNLLALSFLFSSVNAFIAQKAVTFSHTASFAMPTEISQAEVSPCEEPHVRNVLMVECGFGNDSHGQNCTKAAVRACRNAIEFNSLSIDTIIPSGYDGMKLNVILAVPVQYQDGLDLEEVRKVFPYGDINFVIQNGGMVAPSGRQIEALGDTNDDMIIVCAAVQVGY